VSTKLAEEFGMASPTTDSTSNWRSHLLQTPDEIRSLLQRVKRIAVLGIKPEAQSYQPAFYVADYAQQAGYDIVPVPVYYPDVTTILGEPVFRKLTDIPGDIDLVNVFRRPHDVPAHVDDILAKRPTAVWMQSGIAHPAVAEQLAREGIDVVQDRCLMVELRRLARA
jgi:predicted CoA-binding protein